MSYQLKKQLITGHNFRELQWSIWKDGEKRIQKPSLGKICGILNTNEQLENENKALREKVNQLQVWLDEYTIHKED